VDTPKQILLVEDDSTTVTLASQMLKKSGYGVTVARDGLEGLKCFRELKPHLVICDVVMPRMDGISFCRNIKKENSSIPVIVISTKLNIADSVLAAGVQSFIPKPIDMKILLSKVVALIGEVVPAQPEPVSASVSKIESIPAPSPEPKPADKTEEKKPVPDLGIKSMPLPAAVQPEKTEEVLKEIDRSSPAMTKEACEQRSSKKILVVDDDPVMQKMLKVRLEVTGYAVISAGNGQEGLEKIGQGAPDLIITDALMPTMDGYSFCKELRKNEANQKIPILVITGREKLKDAFEALGVEYFIKKPFSIEDLLDIIDQRVGIKRKFTSETPSQESAAEDLPVSPVPTAETEPKAAMPETEIKEKVEKAAEEPVSKPEPLPEPQPEALPQEISPQAQASKPKEAAAQKTPGTGKKILVYGIRDDVLAGITQQLEGQGCQVTIVKEEGKVAEQVDALNPDLILLQFHTAEIPVDVIAADLSALIRKKVRESETLRKKKKNAPIFLEPPIILYKTMEEVSAGLAGSDSLSAMEDLLRKCMENGVSKYIGTYTALSFMGKMKDFLKN